MKKKLLLSMFLFVIIAMCSCRQDTIYSCDSEIDKWTKQNLTEISTMTRSQWLDVDSKVSIAVYRAFNPKQKHVFWIEKIKEVLLLDWNEKEEAHLNVLLEYITSHPELFNAKSRNQDKLDYESDKFQYVWTEYAKESLGWDKEIIGSIVATGNKLKNKKGEVIGLLNADRTASVITKTSSESDQDKDLTCHCAVKDDWCGRDSDCKDNGCKTTDRGCGWLLLKDCTGRCQLY